MGSRFKNSFISMLSLRCLHWHPSGDNEWESRIEYRVQEGELWILCLNLKVISKQRVPKALRVGEVIKRIHVQGEKEKRWKDEALENPAFRRRKKRAKEILRKGPVCEEENKSVVVHPLKKVLG